MTDIVERLRTTASTLTAEKLFSEAADEIERLTKERDFARDAVIQKCRQYDADMEIMRISLTREINEIERLRGLLTRCKEGGNVRLKTSDTDRRPDATAS